MRHVSRVIPAAVVFTLLFCGFTCNNSTKRLATASDAIAHALADAQTAANQAVQSGVMTAQENAQFNQALVSVATAGQQLDSAIRGNETATSVQQKVSNFLTAFDTLQQTGLIGIKDAKTKLAISTILNGAEASVAVIAANVGR